MKRVTENDHPSDHGNVAVNVWVAVHVTMRVTVAPFYIKSRLLWETTFFWKLSFNTTLNTLKPQNSGTLKSDQRLAPTKMSLFGYMKDFGIRKK